MKKLFKYIIVDTGAILFSEETTHSQVAEGFINNNQKVYSAGFVEIEQQNIITLPEIKPFGESSSLKIKSNPIHDKVVIGDLFAKISAIKYYGLNIKQLYK